MGGISDKMSRYFTVLLSFGLLSPLLMATGEIKCSQPESVLKQVPNVATQLTECLLECTWMTYVNKQQLQDNHNIRLKDSTEGDLGEYCWSTDLTCTIGESLHRAYVVVPVDVATVGHSMLEVRSTAPTIRALHPHSSLSTIADGCGLRYDVTEHLSAGSEGALFCLQVTARENILGDNLLRCPPHLVTFWQRNQPSLAAGK